MSRFPSLARRATRSALFRLYDPERLLARAARRGDRRLAFAWVRGVGDVAFVLNEFTRLARRTVPGAEVTALVRRGLEEPCRWIPELHDVVAIDEWSREPTLTSLWEFAYPTPWHIRRALARRGLAGVFDRIVPYPLGPWYERDRLARRPSLRWGAADRRFGEDFRRREAGGDDAFVVALNMHTGTSRFYDHVKEWGRENFDALIAGLLAAIPESRLVLVDGDRPWDVAAHPRVVEARGRLSIGECVSVIAAADLFIGLDTGPVNLVYFLEDVAAELVVLIGRRSVFTPLEHPPASAGVRLTALFGADDDARNIPVREVLAAARGVHARRRQRT